MCIIFQTGQGWKIAAVMLDVVGMDVLLLHNFVCHPMDLWFISKRNYHIKYRVAQHVSDLSWVDFDMDVPLILPSRSAHSADPTSAQAESGRQWKSRN